MRYNEKEYMQFSKPDEGLYTFKILEAPVAAAMGKSMKVTFSFLMVNELGESQKRKTSIPAWEVGDVWRALGFEKDGEFWDIEPEDCIGKTFKATVKHEQGRGQNANKIFWRVRNVVLPDQPVVAKKAKPVDKSEGDLPPRPQSPATEEEPSDDLPPSEEENGDPGPGSEDAPF